MSESNPFQQPQAELVNEGVWGFAVSSPSARPIGSGWRWLRAGWSLFASSWGLILVALLIFMVISFGLQLVPFIGGLAAAVLGPILFAGLLDVMHKLDQEGTAEISDLFNGFQQRTAPLALLGVINLVFTIVLAIVIVGAMFGVIGGDFDSAEEVLEQSTGAILVGLIALAIAIPYAAAMWFATPLVYFGERSPLSALKESLVACLKNILPMLWYSIIALILMVIALIPFGLGLLLLIPAMSVSYYVSFKDIFIDPV